MATRGRVFLLTVAMVLLLCCGIVGGSPTPSISQAAMLLPFPSEQFVVSHNLSATGGCFKWTVSDPRVVKIEPLVKTGQCVDSIAVMPIAPVGQKPARLAAWITAEDRNGQIDPLRCDVFVDSIKKIKIGTTSRTMFQDDKEEVQVVAFDFHDNMFSTVEGIQFDWQVKSLNPSGTVVVQTVDFEMVSVNAPSVIMHMQKKGLQSNRILLEGIDTGKAELTVTLSNHPEVEKDTVILQVKQNLQLEPHEPQYVAPGTDVQYTLFIKVDKSGHRTKIAMPKQPYVWSVETPAVATIDNLGLVRTKALGDTKVVVRDPMSDSRAEGVVLVVEPQFITIKIAPVSHPDFPMDKWFLVAGDTYILDVEVQAADHIPINMEQMTFDTTINLEYFNIVSKRQNNGHFELTAKIPGRCDISSKLLRVGQQRPSKDLATRREALITSRVTISPTEVFLPWNPPSVGSRQEFTFKASGGSGDYNWNSVDPTITFVDQKGLASANAAGSTLIVVKDANNNENTASAKIHVEMPATLYFLPGPVEIQETGTITLEVAAKRKDGTPFHNCSGIALSWGWEGHDQQTDEHFNFLQSIKTAPSGTSSSEVCGRKTVLAVKEGVSTVLCQFPGTSVVAKTKIFAYQPVHVVPPHSLVTLGSAATYTIEGGPFPWHLDNSLHYSSMVPTHNNVTTMRSISDSSHPKFTVTCQELGSQVLNVNVGNYGSDVHKFPYALTGSAVFECVLPHRLLLKWIDQAKLPNGCSPAVAPMDDLDQIQKSLPLPTRLQLRQGRELPVSLMIQDERGRLFDNCSSLAIDWTVTDNKLAQWVGTQKLSRTLKALSNWDGTTVVRASVSGLEKDSTPAKYKSGVPFLTNPLLSRELTLTVSANVALAPDKLRMFNSPSVTRTIETRGGSGTFTFQAEDTAIISIAPKFGGSTVEIAPLRAGTTKIIANDLCLSSSVPVQAEVTVTDVESITSAAPSLVPVEGTIFLDLNVLDTWREPIELEYYKLLPIKVEVESPKILRVGEYANPRRVALHGLSAGSSQVIVSLTRRDGRTISSLPLNIYVFAPFTVVPEKVVLLPGSVYRLGWSGGPPAPRINLNAANGAIGQVTQSGVVTALSPGETTITVTALKDEKEYGRSIVRLIVLEPTEMQFRFRYPTNVLQPGADVMVWLEPMPDHYVSLGATFGPFKWESSDPSVASIVSIYDKVPANTGVQQLPFSVRVQANSPGNAVIKVTTDKAASFSMRQQELHVTVVEPLTIQHCTSSISMAQHSTYQVRTNKESSNIMYSAVQPAPFSVSTSGFVRASSSVGVGSLVVRDSDGNAVSLAVVVKDPKGFTVTASTPSPARQVPIGGTTEFTIIPHDNFGLPFDSNGNYKFEVYSNLDNVVSVPKMVEGTTLAITGIAPGVAVIRLKFLESTPAIETYFEVKVQGHKDELAIVVHMGGKVNFATGPNAVTAWESDNARVMSVDSKGMGTATTIGHATISNRLGSSQSVTVTKITKIIVAVESLSRFQHKLTLPIFFEGPGEQRLTLTPSSHIDHNIVHECIVSDINIIAKAEVDRKTGEYSCVLTIPASSSQNQVQLLVKAHDTRKTYQIETHETVPIRTGFRISNWKPEVWLSSSQRSFVLEVHQASPTFYVGSSDPSRVMVQTTPFDPVTGRLQVQIWVPDVVSASFSGVTVTASDVAEPGHTETTVIHYGQSMVPPSFPQTESQDGRGRSSLFTILGVIGGLAFALCLRKRR